MIDNQQWQEFVSKADTYNGPLTVGQLFCKLFRIKDPVIANADNDSVWQMIVNNYCSKG